MSVFVPLINRRVFLKMSAQLTALLMTLHHQAVIAASQIAHVKTAITGYGSGAYGEGAYGGVDPTASSVAAQPKSLSRRIFLPFVGKQQQQ